MAPSNSKWWQAPDEADLDYGFDSDDLDRFIGPKGNPRRPRPTNEIREQGEGQDSSKNNADKGVLGNMTDWLSRHVGSHNSQLAATAVFSAVTVAGGILGYQAHQRRGAVRDLKASIPAADDRHPSDKLTDFGAAEIAVPMSKEDERSAALARRAQQGDYDDDLILEQLARNRVFLTDDGLAKLRSSFIVVVGCGGVGSHAAASLARSGVSKIRLIDFDQVTLSSLNRHALATLADVGTPKVHCIRRRLEQIAPWVMFDCRNELFGKEAAENLLGPWTLTHEGEGRRPDYVLDCIDNITSKVDLLHYCHTNSLPVISSMGAGCKSDPTRVVVGDISLSTEDPLSRSTRRRLKAKGVSSGIATVFSTEKPGPGKASLLPLPEDEFAKGQVGELGVLPDFRVRILPVLGTMPAVFGYTVANHVICSVSNYPIDYSMVSKGRDKMYDSALATLQGLSERLNKQVAGEDAISVRIPISRDDIAFLMEEVWRGKSAITGLQNRLMLVPWRVPAQGWGVDPKWAQEGQKILPLDIKELVCMTKDEATYHEREVLRGGKTVEEAYEETILQRVNLRLKEAEEYEKYRDHELDLPYRTSHSSPRASRFSRYSRPLIDSVRNGWQSHSNPAYHHLSPDNDKHPGWLQMAMSIIAAPRFRRYVIVYLTLFLLGWSGWSLILYPRLEERSSLLHALDPASKAEAGGWFGTNSLPRFDDLIQIRTLDPDFLPTVPLEGDADWKKKRLIIVGDVHGCKEELVELLDKVSFSPANGDHLIFTGDLINKGPDSAGVVDLAREHSASCVRGNHEDRVLLLRHDIVASNTMAGPAEGDVEIYSEREMNERALARSLNDEQASWLDLCPVILDLGLISGMGQTVVVHGGLVPGVELERQDPLSVMTMRTIDLDTHVPSSSSEGFNWAKMFDKHQSILHTSLKASRVDPDSQTTTVIYGHDAKTSLNIRTYTKGLDTGCVKGGKLTAMTIEPGGKQKLVQVKCHKYLTD
ncbi:Molybdenum cofactor biosynthesis MoeB [Penicillium malachiteum]|uniref:Molybdenum cofactor biosynthesis MoeB n=1 Tax=Penicillium malachiteum TaxID=1324776 RepID=A0AAD6MRL8_9EURO|nr:Molybdenum cofactor biosynthesis MoeB [Penicillium malachiteum]